MRVALEVDKTNHALMRSELRVEPPHSISQSREVAYLATLIRSKSQVRILPLQGHKLKPARGVSAFD